MQIHHGKHHQTYVTNLNTALDKHPELHSKSLDDLFAASNSVPEDIRTAVRNNGGGHWNHSLFWKLMAPNAGGAPTGDVANAINAAFGASTSSGTVQPPASADSAAAGRGSSTTAGKLEITSTPNQDNPLMDGKNADARRRRLGARLLPEVPEPPARLPRRVVERGQLGGSE